MLFRLAASAAALLASAVAQVCPRPVPPAQGLPVQLAAVVPLQYSDGYQTFGSMHLPAVTPPACGWPLVVFVHPLGNSRADEIGLQRLIAGQGYAVWSYDVRAQGQAALSNANHPQAASTLWGPVERCDLAEAILFAASSPNWAGSIDPERIAVVGSSQGGVHGWNAAAFSGQALQLPGRAPVVFPNIACVVCNDYVAEPIDDWLRGGLLWSSWFLEAIDGSYPVALDAQFVQAARSAFLAQDPAALLAHFVQEGRPIAARLQASTVPVLYSHAYHDMIDSPLPTLRLFENMVAPRRALLSTIGHVANQNLHEREYRDALILRWLHHWLWQEPNEVELEEPFVLSEMPLVRVLREDLSYPWSRHHGGDPLVAHAPCRLYLHEDRQLRATAPQLPQPAAAIQQLVLDPQAFTPANYLATPAARTATSVLGLCPLSELVYQHNCAEEQQLDASVRLHLRLVPDQADWQLAVLLTVQPPGFGTEEVMLSSACLASSTSLPGIAEEHELVLPPVAVRVPAGATLRLRLRNHWLREAPMSRAFETAPRFHEFRVEVVHYDGVAGSWADLPLRAVRPKLAAGLTWFPLATAPVVDLAVRGGMARAGQPYFLTAGLGGHLPVTPFLNDIMPLENDWLVGIISAAWHQPQFTNFFGLLDGNGEALAQMDFSMFAPLPPELAGLRLTFAGFVFDGFAGISGAATNPCDVFLR